MTSFFKYLYYIFNESESIALLNYERSSQLRRSLLNMGPRPIYIFELPKSLDLNPKEQAEFLLIIQSLKSGSLGGTLSGSQKILLMNSLHVILAGNWEFHPDLCSSHKWGIFRITKDCRLEASRLSKESKDKE